MIKHFQEGISLSCGAFFLRARKVMIATCAVLAVFVTMHTAEAQLYGNLEIAGTTSVQLKGRTGSFKIAKLINYGDPATTTGTIELTMWATRSRYRGGTIVGAQVLTCQYDGLIGGYQYSKIHCRGRIAPPRRGSYYVTITAAEYDEETGEFFTQDYITFSKKFRF